MWGDSRKSCIVDKDIREGSSCRISKGEISKIDIVRNHQGKRSNPCHQILNIERYQIKVSLGCQD